MQKLNNLMAHALLHGVITELSGGNAAAGATGAVTGELSAPAIALLLYGTADSDKLTASQKENLSALATLASGIAAGVGSGSASGAVTGAQAGKNAVENNALSDIIENHASGQSQEEKYQKAQDALVKATKEFKAKNCAGLSAEACGAKMEAHRDELLKGFADAGLDFVPVVGTVKTLAEAQSALDYLTAAASLIPGERVASAILKKAEKVLNIGNLAEASKLINKASDDVTSANYFRQERKYWSAEPVQFKGNKVYQRNDIFELEYVDPESGKTNLELMQMGRDPIGKDGNPVNLHHMLQKQDGPIAEVTQKFHKDNHSVIHINDNSIPSGINRSGFNKWRSAYWKQRANDFN